MAALVAYLKPDLFTGLRPGIPWLLGLVMLGVGMTISLADLKRVFSRFHEVGIGVGAQFVVMPLAAWVIAMVLQLPPELAVGVILLGCCPGGTASNVIAFLARGDVALSVTMTAAATLIAPVATPFLTWALAGSWIPVNAWALLVDIVKIVLLPMLLGVTANHFLRSSIQQWREGLALFSILCIVLIVAIVVALSRGRIADAGLLVMAAVVLHNAFGLGFGYLLARLTGMGETQSRAVSVEVGMQNSGLASALAIAHFSPLAALPGALFSVWHNITGPALASYWGRKSTATRSPSRKTK
ncbi:MAG: bile acid:sodium symporter family protein [Candidatus Sumerlaeia bacterium]|nr:bile acid:sodium symporter family protein [Candidatus Sumerlaeia bacterium]